MERGFDKFLSKFNFKKIAVWYLIIADVTALAAAGTIGYTYRERLNFALQYSRFDDAKSDEALRKAADRTAAASADVVDVLILDDSDQVTYSTSGSEFSHGRFSLARIGDEKKYLASKSHPDAVFIYTKSEEFMLNSILNRDFGKVRTDYDDDSEFDIELSSKTVYMLNRIKVDDSTNVYVITSPTSVSGGMAILKLTAVTAMLFFSVYWVLVAVWMYRDAAINRLPALYWGVIGLFTNIVGLIVYKIYRRGTATCGVCGAAQSADHWHCSRCGAQLRARCENCGCKIDPADVYCHSCGCKLK